MTATTRIPGVDAAEGALPPATTAGQHASNRLVKVAVKCSALRPWKIVEPVGVTHGRIRYWLVLTFSITKPRHILQRVKVLCQTAHELLALAERHRIECRKLPHQSF